MLLRTEITAFFGKKKKKITDEEIVCYDAW